MVDIYGLRLAWICTALGMFQFNIPNSTKITISSLQNLIYEKVLVVLITEKKTPQSIKPRNDAQTELSIIKMNVSTDLFLVHITLLYKMSVKSSILAQHGTPSLWCLIRNPLPWKGSLFSSKTDLVFSEAITHGVPFLVMLSHKIGKYSCLSSSSLFVGRKIVQLMYFAL